MNIRTESAGAELRMGELCPEHITTGIAADLCGVSKATVLRWIRRGYLAAFRLPDGHYRIRREDFRGFLVEYEMPVAEHGMVLEH
jgi:excisionase family DNA binding protein